jgi:hypothetical protein
VKLNKDSHGELLEKMLIKLTESDRKDFKNTTGFCIRFNSIVRQREEEISIRIYY